MARIFRQTITRYIDSQGKRVKSTTPGAIKKTVKSRVWSGTWRDVNNHEQTEPFSTNKAVAQQMLRQKLDEVERARVGWHDEEKKEHYDRQLSGHIADFAAELRAGLVGNRGTPGEKHVITTVARIRTILVDRCCFKHLRDIDLTRTQEQLRQLTIDGDAPELPPPEDPAGYTKRDIHRHLGLSVRSIGVLVTRLGLAATGNGKARRFPVETVQDLARRRSKGAGEGTAGAYARDLRCFGRWLVKRKRIPADKNPLAELAGTPGRDRRHDRRPLSADELRHILDTTLASTRTVKGLPAADRWGLYLTAMSTGFRASELAILTPGRFVLDGELPVVVLTETETKNGEAVHQPIPGAVAEALASWLATKTADQPLWPGRWIGKPVAVLRRDLAAAGIPYTVPGPDGKPLFADFHALRHSFIALLDRAGATLKEAMQLARHTDPRLTMAVYGRAQLHDLAGAVDRLPGLITTAAKPIPQALAATGTDGKLATSPGVVTALVTVPIAGDGGRVMARDGDEPHMPLSATGRNPLEIKGVAGDCGREMASAGSAPRRTRTYNPLIKSQLLCQLS
jgi:integrase